MIQCWETKLDPICYKFLFCSLSFLHLLCAFPAIFTTWIRICILQADPDPGVSHNVDPDPHRCLNKFHLFVYDAIFLHNEAVLKTVINCIFLVFLTFGPYLASNSDIFIKRISHSIFCGPVEEKVVCVVC